MSEEFTKKEEKKEFIKSVIKRLHDGEDPEKVKAECADTLKGLAPHEIGMIEQELINEGMPREEVHNLCDVHLALFKENVEKSGPSLPEWHPVYILMQEHDMQLDFAEKFRGVANELKKMDSLDSVGAKMEELEHIVHHFKEAESHYLREENILFPNLEKYGIKEPPAIMWMEHDNIREVKKEIFKLLETMSDIKFKDFSSKLGELSITLSELFSSHFFKENNILFPMGLKVLSEGEWIDIRKEFDELGYCCFTPKPAEIKAVKTEEKKVEVGVEGLIAFKTGNLSKEEVETIFDSLPVDVTFVDKDDRVKYFSQSKERIFVRTKAVIGRTVQECHPQKSLHKVNQILEGFKGGKREVAEFWINMKGRLIYIRYFPVVDKAGSYIGCLEVTQDITDIKKIEGEKRLL